MTSADTSADAAWDGRPQNPERDGWHWVQNNQGKPIVWLWHSGGWEISLARLAPHEIALAFRYLGQCLLPDEAAALLARAELAERQAEYAEHSERGQYEARQRAEAERDAALAVKAAAIQFQDRFAAERDAARAKALEEAVEIAERTISPWSIAASDEIAAAIRALTQEDKP